MAYLTVVCVKAPPDKTYDHNYVNRLYQMCKRQLSVPFKFLCFTDDPSGLKCESRKLPNGLVGWWNKLYLFKSGLLKGKVLYLDLDTIIIDSLDFVSSFEGDFAILRDFYRPEGYGSGVMLWNKAPDLWDEWNKAGKPDHGLGDQGFVEKRIKNALRLQDLFPQKFVSFKADCSEKIPEGAAVVCFHGVPKPHQLDPDYLVDLELLDHWVGEIDQSVPNHVLELLDGRPRTIN